VIKVRSQVVTLNILERALELHFNFARS